MGLISSKTAFLIYILLAAMAVLTLDGDMRKFSLALLGLFAVKTYIDVLRRRLEEREQSEAREKD